MTRFPIPVLIKNADLTQLAGNEQLKRDIEDELDLDKKSLSLYTRISQIARNFFEVTGFSYY
ncbi:hypothetical protein DC077_02210 [Ignatzschineria cameli]|uniref:Uncharacterized protein n=1 Tax=Ignatzschineria cameli TaxID=2182793 RepID=A0A2U2ATP9_9GAMM|nr:hypothetical protein DC080_00830 [Ignatzschineria cameli]PWD88109.1 hypothetical protein DC077_02210 [Ignatzschineria cameli]